MVETGQIFGQGGTDGLILYALILADFLMFLALIALLVLTFRALNRRDTIVAEQSKTFAEASNDTADALRTLATAIVSKESADGTHRANLTATLARLEGVLGRIDPQR